MRDGKFETQPVLPLVDFVPMIRASNETLLTRIEHGNAALEEISQNIANPEGMTRETEDELMRSFDGIYEEMATLVEEAERRGLEHSFSVV